MSDRNVSEIEVREKAIIAVIQRSALDERAAAALEDEIVAAAAQHPGLPVILDFGKVQFAPSVALGTLVRIRNGFKFENRRLLLANLTGPVRGTVNVTRLHRIVEVHATLDAALAAI